MKKKALLTLASFGLLVMVAMYATIAWYTNIANVTGLTFDVADFNFKVNYAADNFIIQLDDYLNVTDDKAAPGTGGVIPIQVQAEGAVGATYAINLDLTNMAPEFQDRIRFFYYTKDADGNYVEHLLGGDTADITGTIVSSGSQTEYIYWEWIYTADITPILIAPYEDNGILRWTNEECMDDMTYEEIKRAVKNWNQYLNGDNNEAVTAKYNELKALGHMEHMDPMDDGGAADTTFESLLQYSGRALKEAIETEYLDEHDEFDTELAFGLYDTEFVSENGKTYKPVAKKVDGSGGITSVELKAYQAAMEVTLMVSGAQAMPLRDNGSNSWATQGTTEYVPATELP